MKEIDQAFLNACSGNEGVDTLQELLGQGANINAANENGKTALHHAVCSSLIIHNQGICAFYAEEPKNPRALEKIKFLVESGVNLNAQDNVGATALRAALNLNSLSSSFGKTFYAIGSDGSSVKIGGKKRPAILIDICRFLISQKTLDINNRDKEGNSYLLTCLVQNCPEEAVALAEQGINVNLKNKNGDTALHIAAAISTGFAEFLLGKGAGLSAQNNGEYSPLFKAAQHNNVESVKMLIGHGADPYYVIDPNKINVLHIASTAGARDVVKFLWENYPDLNVKDQIGRASIHFSIAVDAVECVRFFIDKGVNFKEANKKGNTCLHIAAGNRALDTLKLLINKGAELNTQNIEGQTPLQFSIQYQAVKEIKALIEAGADLSIKDSKGRTALDIAQESGDKKITALLKKSIK